jgi:hypothetical protein
MAEESVLSRLHKTSIRVTDIANQFWCERQMELNYLYGQKFTKEMAKGRKIHETLQEEVCVPITIEPVTYRDYMYKTAYENAMSLRSLKANGICREVRVYGSVNGFRISGQIDEMKVREGKVQVVERKTTEAGKQLTGSYTKPHIVQIMLYRKMLDDIRSRRYALENFCATYGLGPGKEGVSDAFRRELVAMGLKEENLDIYEMYKKMFSEMYSMPELSDRLEIAYMDRFSGNQIASLDVEYSEGAVNRELGYAMGYWLGRRESAPVPESETRKCGLCKFFGRECKVWWKG